MLHTKLLESRTCCFQQILTIFPPYGYAQSSLRWIRDDSDSKNISCQNYHQLRKYTEKIIYNKKRVPDLCSKLYAPTDSEHGKTFESYVFKSIFSISFELVVSKDIKIISKFCLEQSVLFFLKAPEIAVTKFELNALKNKNKPVRQGLTVLNFL